MNSRSESISAIVKACEELSDSQLLAVLRFVSALAGKIVISIETSDLFSIQTARAFGDKLLAHHSGSQEALSKDRFEHALKEVLSDVYAVEFAPRGNPGHDLTIAGEKFSLKTQANKNIHAEKIWISKWMELGRGAWTDKPEQLDGLLTSFLNRLETYDRILVLRAFHVGNIWTYELIEIPKAIMASASAGELTMMSGSKQMPKPGYCRVYDKERRLQFALYFDGGTERKLQVKDLLATLCQVHVRWVIGTN